MGISQMIMSRGRLCLTGTSLQRGHSRDDCERSVQNTSASTAGNSSPNDEHHGLLGECADEGSDLEDDECTDEDDLGVVQRSAP